MCIIYITSISYFTPYLEPSLSAFQKIIIHISIGMSIESRNNCFPRIPLAFFCLFHRIKGMNTQETSHYPIPSSITIDINTANQRLDRFLRKYFRKYPDISLVMIFKAIRTGQIKVNKSWNAEGLKGWKVDQSYKLQIWDQLIFHESFLDLLTNKNPVAKSRPNKKKENNEASSLEDFQSRIISEDDERLVINKPAGISIHPWQKVNNEKWIEKNISESTSLYDLIKQYYSSRGFSGSMFQPNVAYRLDKDTSGLVIVAKTYQWLQYLNEQIRDHKVDKEYYAIVLGRFPQQLTCNKPMKKVIDQQFGRGKMTICSPDDLLGQEAKTIWYNEKSRSDPVLGTLTLVRVQLFTGRMHQIRVHFANAGYPVLGDIVYWNPSHNRKLQQTYWFLRQLLHCHCYSFTDSNWKKVSFEAPLMDDMKKVMK